MAKMQVGDARAYKSRPYRDCDVSLAVSSFFKPENREKVFTLKKGKCGAGWKMRRCFNFYSQIFRLRPDST
jgi:hypothetical protein